MTAPNAPQGRLSADTVAPRPYYDEGGITIYHGRAEDILPGLKGQVAITDPPYGWGSYATDQEAAVSVLRACLGLRTAALFGYPELLVKWCIALGRVPDEWVTWWSAANKSRAVGSGLAKESECIAVFGPIHGERIFRSRKQGNWPRNVAISRGLDPDWCRDGDVWREAAEGIGVAAAHKRLHPNQKPLELMRRLVLLCSDEGETILDPYIGSGTTLRAAKDCNRRAIGVEVEERYCEIAAHRLAQEVLMLDLPEPAPGDDQIALIIDRDVAL